MLTKVPFPCLLPFSPEYYSFYPTPKSILSGKDVELVECEECHKWCLSRGVCLCQGEQALGKGIKRRPKKLKGKLATSEGLFWARGVCFVFSPQHFWGIDIRLLCLLLRRAWIPGKGFWEQRVTRFWVLLSQSKVRRRHSALLVLGAIHFQYQKDRRATYIQN